MLCTREPPIKTISRFVSRNFAGQKGVEQYIQISGEEEKKKHNFQPRTVYTAKLPFRIEGGIKSFPDKQKLKEFISTTSALKEMLKGLLKAEKKGC